jgi:hypothetical protein
LPPVEDDELLPPLPVLALEVGDEDPPLPGAPPVATVPDGIPFDPDSPQPSCIKSARATNPQHRELNGAAA